MLEWFNHRGHGDKLRELRSHRFTKLGQRFGFGCGFFQDIRRHFPDGDMEFKHRRFCAATPTVYFPVSADELRFAVRGQIEQQGMLATIKLLGESDEWLRAPGSAVSGTVDAHVQGLLFDDVSDVEGQKEDAVSGSADFQSRPVAFGVGNGLLGNQKSIDRRCGGMAREL